MSSCVAELDAILQSMLALKAPGVTQPKITSITALCNANVQSETVLIQKIYTHFKKAPGTHKLGVLYVVDSVTRQWVEQARKANQPTGSSAPDGTFAAGVNHVTELLPSFMNDIINAAPEEQKVKIRKLIDIWERGNTFPASMLSNFKDRLSALAMQSTTPTGTPPKDNASLHGQSTNGLPPPTTDTSTIIANLHLLANMAKQNISTPVAGNPVQTNGNSTVTFPQNTIPQTMQTPVNAAMAMPPQVQAVNLPAANGVFSYPGMGTIPQNFLQSLAGQPNMQATPQVPATPVMPQAQSNLVNPELLQQQIQILNMLKQQGIPDNQWATVLHVLMANSGAAGTAPVVNQPNYGGFTTAPARDESRDPIGYDQYSRSPPNRYTGRKRSRSPSPPGWDRERRRDRSPPPRRRDSPVYGEYGNERNGNRGENSRRGGGKGRDRDRSKPQDKFVRSPSPRRRDEALPNPGPKWIEYDRSIDEGMIKVLSRTLFVGGVTSSEEELRSIFAAFGRVQTCIVNVDKRHAFVKMITRNEAMAAKEGMEHYKSPEMQLRTRWGVGFGPRDCSDYQTGISIIPIERLTDADRKWMLSAEYGGTGGKPIESGLVVEEPDIEIGAGVSSKAISRRMATDKGGQQGPRSTRDAAAPSASGGRYRQPDRNQNQDVNAITVPPAVPGFGFQFPTMPNGMPMFPNFYPGTTTTAQPPPPGAT